jgi:alkylresorcinol/alkylpyrone synthase
VSHAVVMAVGTALPQHRVAQSEVQNLCRALFSQRFRDLERLISVFDNGQIQSRFLCEPLQWLSEDHSFAEKNSRYVEHALQLGEQAARQALHRANLDISAIGTVLFVSTTGLATPSLDSLLLKRLGASVHTRRLPIWGLGCAGGASGLARAAELAQATGQAVLLIAVELCSLTFQRHDYSKSNIIATSLFADGAAAVVISPTGNPNTPNMKLMGGFSTLWPDTEDVMGWDIIETGLKVRFSRDVPSLVMNLMRENIELASSSVGLSRTDLRHFVTHPGGLKVLNAYIAALELPSDALDHSFAVLAECGNMSSVSVLFVLERFLREQSKWTAGEYGVVSAMGPGFSAEHVFFQIQ